MFEITYFSSDGRTRNVSSTPWHVACIKLLELLRCVCHQNIGACHFMKEINIFDFKL